MRKLLLVWVGIMLPWILLSNYYSFLPYTVTQPNGEVIQCFVSGDEYFNWLHDKEGFTIIQASDGYYYYAKSVNGEVKATSYKVNTISPSKVGLTKWAKLSESSYQKAKDFYRNESLAVAPAPHTGALNNIVVYIRFSDDTEFSTTRQSYDDKFNSASGASMKSYFSDVSYGNLLVNSTHYPECPLATNYSYQDSHPRAYFEPYNASTNPIGYNGGNNGSERTAREQTLLRDAISWINANSPVPPSLNLDGDGDGYIDNVCFIVKGGNGAWNALLWAHSWALYYHNVTINGKRLWEFTFQPETQCNVRTLCHEMFHAIGAPDLYHYTSNGISPVDQWDLMEYGSGHMGAYMKWKYSNQNWIASIPEITSTGTYTLNPLASSSNNCYKIRSPYSEYEFFMVEYRRKTGLFESNVPGSGLLVYRIDTRYSGNAGGPPDEVYIYRPGGTTSSNGSPSQAFFSSESGRTSISDATNPSAFLQNGSIGGLDISNVSSAGNTISFDVKVNYLFNPTSFNASNVGSSQIDLQWVKNGNNNDVLLAWNTTPDFGTPQEGIFYNPGEAITGGGTVLLAGAGSQYSHTGLESGETYYYKLWSVNQNGNYSMGTTFNASTWCPIIAEFPYSQNFTNAKKPGCWEVQSSRQPAQNWQFGVIAGIDTLPNLNGNYAFLNSFGYGAGSSQNADLLSPFFNFANSTNIIVSFDNYFLDKNQGKGNLSYSTDYGQNWINVQDFSSTSPSNPQAFSVDLTNELAGAGYVKFKFNYTGSYEKYWAIDNFKVTADPDISDTLEITSGEYGEGSLQCFNAYQSIVVGGSERGTVEFFPYSSATFIAGTSIRFLPGFHAREMSQVHAYITATNEFCTSVPGDGVLAMQQKSALQSGETLADPNHRKSIVRVFPNPTSGVFTVDADNGDAVAEISVHNLTGSRVGDRIFTRQRYSSFDLSALQKGIYIVKVSSGKGWVVRKIILQ